MLHAKLEVSMEVSHRRRAVCPPSTGRPTASPSPRARRSSPAKASATPAGPTSGAARGPAAGRGRRRRARRARILGVRLSGARWLGEGEQGLHGQGGHARTRPTNGAGRRSRKAGADPDRTLPGPDPLPRSPRCLARPARHDNLDDKYVSNMRRLVGKMAEGCGWTTLASIRADRATAWLLDIKRNGVPDKDGVRKARLPSDHPTNRLRGSSSTLRASGSLSNGAAVDFSYISTLENGRVPAPSAETIVRLSGILSCPPEDLLAGRSVICSLWNVSDDAGTDRADDRPLRRPQGGPIRSRSPPRLRRGCGSGPGALPTSGRHSYSWDAERREAEDAFLGDVRPVSLGRARAVRGRGVMSRPIRWGATRAVHRG